MKFKITFDVVYETVGDATIEAETLEEAKKLAAKIMKDERYDESKLIDFDEGGLDWNDRTMTLQTLEEDKGE